MPQGQGVALRARRGGTDSSGVPTGRATTNRATAERAGVDDPHVERSGSRARVDVRELQVRRLEGQRGVEPPVAVHVRHGQHPAARVDGDGAVVLDDRFRGFGNGPALHRRGFRLYEGFRPSLPAGERGWGAAGELDLSTVRSALDA